MSLSFFSFPIFFASFVRFPFFPGILGVPQREKLSLTRIFSGYGLAFTLQGKNNLAR